MASVDPGASAAICRSVAAIASLVRYMLTPVDATIAGCPASKPAAASRSHQDRPPRSRPAPAAGTPEGPGQARSGAAASTPEGQADRPRICAVWEANSGRRWAKVSSPAPRMTYCPTPRPACFRDQILDEASTGHDGRAEEAREARVHIRAAAPAIIRSHQLANQFRLPAHAAAHRPGRAKPATKRPAPPCCPALQFAHPASCSLFGCIPGLSLIPPECGHVHEVRRHRTLIERAIARHRSSTSAGSVNTSPSLLEDEALCQRCEGRWETAIINSDKHMNVFICIFQ